MQSPALACRELRRCVSELGLAGVQIGTHVNAWTLDRPELFPVFALAEELGACVFVHPWDMMGGELMRKYWLSWLVAMPAETSLAICSMLFGGVLERRVPAALRVPRGLGAGSWGRRRAPACERRARPVTPLPPTRPRRLPNLRVCFAHGGGSFPGTLGRVQHGFDVRPDLCAVDCPTPPVEQVGRFWADSLVHDPVALDLIVKVFGAGGGDGRRVAFMCHGSTLWVHALLVTAARCATRVHLHPTTPPCRPRQGVPRH